jgi:hypothetical protein
VRGLPSRGRGQPGLPRLPQVMHESIWPT